jgi:hypothetical protein
MSLSNVQQDFTYDIGCLIRWAYDQGYELTFGDAYRSPAAHGDMGEQGPYGKAWSAHKQRLAVDFNLFIDGEWQQSTEAFRPLGEFWESLHTDNVWGGNFQDGNHFSRRWNGIA